MRFSFLAGRPGYRLGVAAAIVIALPTLGFGFFVDDYWHLMKIERGGPLSARVETFAFGMGDPEHIIAEMKTGPYPWFMDTGFKARFFRPLAGALMIFDRALFGRYAPAYHLHSVLWYGLLACGAMLILRRTFAPAVGVLALLLFVLDESHAFPVAWWSNRNAVMATAFGFLGVAAHLRWREDGWRPGLSLSLAAFAAGLLSAEIGLCALAYVLAYELFGARDSARRRIRCVAPAALLTLGYLLFYRWIGYGASHSGIYLDPLSEPMGYLSAAPQRFLALMGAQFFALPVEAAILHPPLTPAFVVPGAVALGVVALALRHLWPALEAQERRALRWLIPGALFATLPVLAAIVSSRLLLPASLGGAAVIAVIIAHAWRAGPGRIARPLRGLMWFFIAAHLAGAALSWPVQVAAMRGVSEALCRIMRNAEIDETDIEERRIVIVNAPDPFTGMYGLMLRHFDGKPPPRAWWTLSIAPFDHRLTRAGEREMELEILDGQMMTGTFEQLFRGADRPLRPGDAQNLDGLIVTVLDVADQGPTRIRLEFAEPPESDAYQFIAFQDRAFRKVIPPSLGENVIIPFHFPQVSSFRPWPDDLSWRTKRKRADAAWRRPRKASKNRLYNTSKLTGLRHETHDGNICAGTEY